MILDLILRTEIGLRAEESAEQDQTTFMFRLILLHTVHLP